MPYVTEDDNEVITQRQGRGLIVGGVGGVEESATYVNTSTTVRSRSQYGWRSEGEEAAARQNLLDTLDKNRNWAGQRAIIAAMDRVERSLSNPMTRSPESLVVNERRYTETKHTPRVQERLFTPFSSTTWRFADPVISINLYGQPDLPSESTQRVKAGAMIRGAAPTKPHSNLGQWFGELRDVNRLVARSGRNSDQVIGGAYLNWQFGWKGFLGDLMNAAEAVVNSEELINDFLLRSARLHHRKRSEVLNVDSVQTSVYIPGSTSPQVRTYSAAGLTYSLLWDCNQGLSARYATPLEGFAVASTRTELRSFAVFEFFAFDPEKALERMGSYYQQARQLLGSSIVSASTLYELAPWSWLSDWFFDLGGLLAYQESVASDSLTHRRAGSVVEQISSVHVSARASRQDVPAWSGVAVQERKTSRRLPGSPYSMGVDWGPLSGSQWAILGALGFTKAPSVPAKWH